MLSDVFAFGDMNVNVSAGGRAEVASGQAVSGNYYEGLGVGALVGRTITDDDDRAAAQPVAVLSHRYWQRRFGGDPTVVGRQINLNNVAFTVVGVTPEGFDGAMNLGTSPDVSIPIAWEPQVNGERGATGRGRRVRVFAAEAAAAAVSRSRAARGHRHVLREIDSEADR